MAKFNDKIFGESLPDEDKRQASVYLQALLSPGELEQLKSDWQKEGETAPWWEYALEKISVRYQND